MRDMKRGRKGGGGGSLMNSRTNKGFSPCHRRNFTGHIFRISASFYYCYYYAGNPRRIITRKTFFGLFTLRATDRVGNGDGWR